MFDEKEPTNPEGFDASSEPSAETQPAETSPAETNSAEINQVETNPAMELPEIPAPAQAAMAAPAPEVREHGSRRSGWMILGAAVALAAISAGVGSATTWALARNSANLGARTPVGYVASATPGAKAVSSAAPLAGTDGNVIPGVFRRVSPAVVKISVQTRQGRMSGSATGSGFVVDPRGYILTNHHVIDGATKVTVSFIDGTKFDGKVVGKDKSHDLAVIQVDPGNRSLVAVPLGDSSAVQVGELAIAIGSPLGKDFTVTAGIVSALDRELEEDNNPFSIPGAIQTDAAINPGNSGGPLLNANGEVIGINTAIESPVSGSIGIGFAVPINLAKEVLPTMISGQEVKFAWLGVTMQDLTADAADEIGTSAKEGAVVIDVYRGSPASKAGIKPAGLTRRGAVVSADVITEIDGKPIKGMDDLRNYVASKRVGDTINLTVVRGKDTIKISAQLTERPDQLPDDTDSSDQ